VAVSQISERHEAIQSKRERKLSCFYSVAFEQREIKSYLVEERPNELEVGRNNRDPANLMNEDSGARAV